MNKLNLLVALDKVMDFLKSDELKSGTDKIECYFELKAIRDFLTYKDVEDKKEEKTEREDSVYDVRYKSFYDAFDCLKHMKNHDTPEYIKYKGSFKNIVDLGDTGVNLFDGKEFTYKTYKELINEGATFVDGRPFGREESANEYFFRVDEYNRTHSKE